MSQPDAASQGDAGAVTGRFQGALLGALVGDALGAPLEGHPGPVPPDVVARLVADAAPLRYTDDTAMTMALAESLLHCGSLDEDHLAATFVAHFERDPHRGYGAGTAELLTRIAAGADRRQAAGAQFGGQGSFGNGAAMRVAPVALAAGPNVGSVADLARRSAHVTHTHPAALDGAAVQAVAVALALAQPADRPVDRTAFVAAVRDVATTWTVARQLDVVAELGADAAEPEVASRVGTGVAAAQAVPAALCAFLRHPETFTDAVRFAIGLGGDTDTIASMTGAIAGARLSASAIPARWLERVEGTRAVAHLAERQALRHLLDGRT